jgi:hypothetical protein
LIRLVHDNEGLIVGNNLLSGPEMRVETQSAVQFAGNVTREVADAFVDAAKGDLHLRAPANGIVDAAERVERVEVANDIDGQRRDERADVGADEWSR